MGIDKPGEARRIRARHSRQASGRLWLACNKRSSMPSSRWWWLPHSLRPHLPQSSLLQWFVRNYFPSITALFSHKKKNQLSNKNQLYRTFIICFHIYIYCPPAMKLFKTYPGLQKMFTSLQLLNQQQYQSSCFLGKIKIRKCPIWGTPFISHVCVSKNRRVLFLFYFL